MRTAEEIIARIKEPTDMFGFGAEALAQFITFDEAGLVAAKDMTAESWGPVTPREREKVVEVMGAYMAFAWEKALNHRGISASRSVEKMRSWCWLLGEEDGIPWGSYSNYGAPILKAICERYGFVIPTGPDAENMAAGRPCMPDCWEGCGP